MGRKLNIERAREKADELESRSDSEFHELKQGKNFFFIMLPWSDDVEVIWKEVQQHQMLVCPSKAADGKRKCILCEETRRRRKKGDSDFASNWRLRSRGLFNAIRKEHIKQKDPSNVKILGVSTTVFRDIIEHIIDNDLDISDPEAAIPVCIKKTGEKLKTRYNTAFGSPIDISRYLTDDVMGALWDLDAAQAAQPAGDKELRKAIRGAADEDDDDDFDVDSDSDKDFDLEADDGLEDELFDNPDDSEGSDTEAETEDFEDMLDLDDEIEKEKPKHRKVRKVRSQNTKPAPAARRRKVRRRRD